MLGGLLVEQVGAVLPRELPSSAPRVTSTDATAAPAETSAALIAVPAFVDPTARRWYLNSTLDPIIFDPTIIDPGT